MIRKGMLVTVVNTRMDAYVRHLPYLGRHGRAVYRYNRMNTWAVDFPDAEEYIYIPDWHLEPAPETNAAGVTLLTAE